jgi:acyl carrier protein
MANVSVYVLDERMEPVAIGVYGELYVGGAGLARGYVNLAERTAERFVPDPFSGASGSRLYRTGDVVRYLGSGELEFVGRADHQVKLRGYRIEPGEVEAALLEYAGVREALVVVREDRAGERRLVGYVIGEGELSQSELRAHLAAKLPEQMIPAAFVKLASWPLTSQGKVDRQQLPEPERDGGRASGCEQGAQSTEEELLVGLWQEVLGIERVGVSENFFDLGGHSLLAAQLISRIRDLFHVEILLENFFAAPTVAGLNREIEKLRNATGPSAVPQRSEIRKASRTFDQQILDLEQLSNEQARQLLKERQGI